MSRPLPFRSLALAAVVLAVAAPAVAPAAARFLELDRAAVLSGQVWRLLTGHLVHAGREHLLWDVLPLIAMGFLFEEHLGARFWKVLAASMLAVGGGLVLLDAGLPTYRGLSGVLNGLWVAGALLGARAESTGGSPALAHLYRLGVLLDLGKVAVETYTGVPLFTDPSRLGSRPVPLSHALGLLAGALCVWSPRTGWWWKRWRFHPWRGSAAVTSIIAGSDRRGRGEDLADEQLAPGAVL